MKKNPTFIARILVYFMIIALVAVLLILLPELAREEAVGKTPPPSVYPYILVWIWSIPLFLAAHQTLKLLSFIDKKKAFSERSVTALKKIKYCAIAFGILVVISIAAVIIPVKMVNPSEDAAPIFTIGMVFIFVSSVITLFVAVLEKLLEQAIAIKSENNLTV